MNKVVCVCVCVKLLSRYCLSGYHFLYFSPTPFSSFSLPLSFPLPLPSPGLLTLNPDRVPESALSWLRAEAGRQILSGLFWGKNRAPAVVTVSLISFVVCWLCNLSHVWRLAIHGALLHAFLNGGNRFHRPHAVGIFSCRCISSYTHLWYRMWC